jgi:hypothetical protein
MLERLAESGLLDSPRLAASKPLGEHSTPTLTLGRYAHVAMIDQARALEALPSVSTPTLQPAIAATGTHG